MSDWSEGMIAAAIGQQVLDRKCLLLMDRCNWTGHECDVLAVTQNLRIIDVEIKISRADFKADAKKDKWWHRMAWDALREPRTHPPKVWKHYFAMPEDIWSDALVKFLPSPASGVIVLSRVGSNVLARVRRRAVPARDAHRISPEAAIDIARLANLRMWDAYKRLEAA